MTKFLLFASTPEGDMKFSSATWGQNDVAQKVKNIQKFSSSTGRAFWVTVLNQSTCEYESFKIIP